MSLAKCTRIFFVIYLVQSKVHPDLLQLLYTCGTAISVAVLPWIPNIWGMVAVRGIMGVCCGGQDTGRFYFILIYLFIQYFKRYTL